MQAAEGREGSCGDPGSRSTDEGKKQAAEVTSSYHDVQLRAPGMGRAVGGGVG